MRRQTLHSSRLLVDARVLPLVVALVLLVVGMQVQVTYGQQAPSFFIPQGTKNRSLSVRQNVCAQYQLYVDDESVEMRNALRGLQLHTAIREGKFFHTMLSPEGELVINPQYPGLAAVLMDELAERAGFSWRDSYGIYYALGELEEEVFESWTDIVSWTTDFYDVTVDWFDNTLERLKLGISFPEGFVRADYILVGVPGDGDEIQKNNYWGWLQPFTTDVWVVIAITIVLSGCIYQLLEQLGNPARYRGRRTKDTLGNNIFLSSLLFTQHFQFQPRTPASRVFAASFSAWALLVSSAYTANLASFFIIQNVPEISVTSIDDAIQANLPLCVWKGTASHTFLRQHYPKAMLITMPEEIDVFKAVNKKECPLAVVTYNSFQEYEKDQTVNPDCDLQWIGRTIQHVPSGFAVKADAGRKCTSLIEHVLDLHLREMQLDGFMERAWADYLARNQDSNCGTEQNDESSNNQRTLNEMAGTFLLHLLLTIVAVAIAFTSKLWAPKNEQQRYLGSSKTLSAIERGGSRLSVLTNDPDPYGPATNDPSNFIGPHGTDGNETSAMTDGMFELQLLEMEFKVRRRQDAMQHQLDTILGILQPKKAEPGIASPEFDDEEEEIRVLGYNAPEGLDIDEAAVDIATTGIASPEFSEKEEDNRDWWYESPVGLDIDDIEAAAEKAVEQVKHSGKR